MIFRLLCRKLRISKEKRAQKGEGEIKALIEDRMETEKNAQAFVEKFKTFK